MNPRKISSGWQNAKCICAGERNSVYIITDKIYELFEYDTGLNGITLIQDGDWSKSESCCFAEGFLFVIKDNFIYRINVRTHQCEIFNKDDWGNSKAMIYDSHFKRIIVIVEKIWCVNPFDGSYFNITEQGWSSTKTAAVIGNSLYVTAANTWMVDLTKKDTYTNLFEGLSHPKSLIALNERLFGFSNNQILHIDYPNRRVSEVQTKFDSLFGNRSDVIKNGVVACPQFNCFFALHENGDLSQYTFI